MSEGISLKISGGMEFFQQDRMPCQFPEHFHEYYVMGVLLRGERLFKCDGIGGKLRKYQIIIINPGQMHKCQAMGKEPSTWLAAHFSVQTINKFLNGKQRPGYIPVFQQTVLSDATVLEKLLSLAFDHTERSAEDLLSCLLSKPLSFLPYGLKSKKLPQHFLSIFQQWQIQPSLKISLEEMAKQARMSKYTFLKKFKAQMGISPYRYLEIVRLNLARKKIREGQPLSQCAQSLGYYDQSHFTRHFTQNFGISPGCLRKVFFRSKGRNNEN